MSKRIKILFIHHAYGWGGAPISMMNTIIKLDQSKFQVEVLILKEDSIVAKKLTENGIIVKVAHSNFYKKIYFGFIHSEAGYFKWYHLFRMLKSLFIWFLSRSYFAGKELDNHEFDIVHLNSSIMSDWLAPAKKRGKVVIHIREPFRNGRLDILHCLFVSQMSKYADRIIAISEDNCRRIGIPEKTEVIYNHTSIPFTNPLKHSYYSNKVLYLGGCASIKGFYTIIKALDFLEKDVKIYFCGSYVYEGSKNTIKKLLKKLLRYDRKRNTSIKKLLNHPNAIVCGLTDNVQLYFKEVCCLIAPSVVPHFLRPVIEAFANHKPVIVTDIEGIEELVTHRSNGIIVPKNNPRQLAEAINLLCTNGNLAIEMGHNGYKEALKKYSPTNIDKIISIYNSL